MKSPIRYILLFLVLGSLAGIAIGFRSFFMANFVEPVALLCWAVWRIIISVDQNICWGILIVVCVILAFRLIPSREDNLPNPSYTYRYKSPHRVEFWQKMISESLLAREDIALLRGNLATLLASAIAKPGQAGATGLEEIVATSKRPLSLRAVRFLFPQKRSDGAFFRNHRLDVKSLISKRLRDADGKFVRQDTLAIAEILEYMEAEMEMSHDR